MSANTNGIAPNLSYWNCDKYPYFIPIIKEIEHIRGVMDPDTLNTHTSDEFHCIIKGNAEYEIINGKTGDSVIYNVKENHILFFPKGIQYHKILNCSDDFEYLRICFSLCTCTDSLSGTSLLDVSELINSPTEHRRMYLNIPTLSKSTPDDDISYHISRITEEFNARRPGYTIQTQTHLLQFILSLFESNKSRYTEILKNINRIGITSKANPYTLFPKGAKLTISDFEIFSSNPHTNKPNLKLLSRFKAHRFYMLEPKSDDLSLSASSYTNKNIDTVVLTSSADTKYHIWLNPDNDVFTPDLSPYIRSGYMRFYAKCNIEMMFGVTIYNHVSHRYINHTFHIMPNKKYTEYCVPLLAGDHESGTNPHIYKIIAYIEQNYERKIKLEDLANHIHLNPSYVSVLFKSHMGISLSDYILNYRLTIAKKLLINDPSRSINDIALQVGFFDAAHFTKTFKAIYSITPKEYRARHG